MIVTHAFMIEWISCTSTKVRNTPRKYKIWCWNTKQVFILIYYLKVLRCVCLHLQVRQLQQVMPFARLRLTRLWLPWNLMMTASWRRYWWVSKNTHGAVLTEIIRNVNLFTKSRHPWALGTFFLDKLLSGRSEDVFRCVCAVLNVMLRNHLNNAGYHNLSRLLHWFC